MRRATSLVSMAVLSAAMLACGAPEPRAVTRLTPPAVAGAAWEATDVALAVDPDSGHVLMSWVGRGDSTWWVWFARSRDGGRSWSEPVRANDRPGEVAPHGEASPRLITAPRGVVAIAWPHAFKVPGRTYGADAMRLVRSTDGGRTWKPARTLNGDTLLAPTSHTFHGAAWAGDSTLLVAWLNERATPNARAAQEIGPSAAEANATLYLARSDDWGRTWQPNVALHGEVCPCCRVAMARDPSGGVTAVWRQHYGDDVRDIAAAKLTPFTESVRVFADEWVYPGCPHTGPAVDIDPAGRIHVSWYTGKPGATGIRYARGTDQLEFEDAVFLTTAAMPTAHTAVAALPDGRAVVAYDRDATGAQRLTVVATDQRGRAAGRYVVPDSEGADHPSAVAVPGGAVVGWGQQVDGRWKMSMVFVSVP